jgi:hypothetical protein
MLKLGQVFRSAQMITTALTKTVPNRAKNSFY